MRSSCVLTYLWLPRYSMPLQVEGGSYTIPEEGKLSRMVLLYHCLE